MIWLYVGAALVVLGIVARWADRREQRQAETKTDIGAPRPERTDDTCCGQHEVCEKESLLAAVSKQVEYYDDEELDAYRGTASDAYTDEALEAFREVLYTLREEEVAGWVRSLQLRHVALPDALKDEVILIVGERRLA